MVCFSPLIWVNWHCRNMYLVISVLPAPYTARLKIPPSWESRAHRIQLKLSTQTLQLHSSHDSNSNKVMPQPHQGTYNTASPLSVPKTHAHTHMPCFSFSWNSPPFCPTTGKLLFTQPDFTQELLLLWYCPDHPKQH